MVVEKYKIIGENIDNFDKKKFIIEVKITSAQMITYKELVNCKIIRASQNGSKE